MNKHTAILESLRREHELYGAGWDSFGPFVLKALQAQDEAWKEKVRGLKMDTFHYAADMDWENGWADAVTKFNLKIDTLLEEI